MGKTRTTARPHARVARGPPAKRSTPVRSRLRLPGNGGEGRNPEPTRVSDRPAARRTCGCFLSRGLPVRFWPGRLRCSAVKRSGCQVAGASPGFRYPAQQRPVQGLVPTVGRTGGCLCFHTSVWRPAICGLSRGPTTRRQANATASTTSRTDRTSTNTTIME